MFSVFCFCFPVELSLREISYVIYVHALNHTLLFTRANDAKIVRCGDAMQFNKLTSVVYASFQEP